MARIRSIKPDFFLDDEVATLHPLTRILFIGLWCLADKSGRLEDKPTKIKVQVLPYDKFDVDAELSVLAKNGFIIRYTVEGMRYIQVSSFEKHQRVHHTEKESNIPEYNGEITVNDRLEDGDNPVGKERKGKERKGIDETGKCRHGDGVFLTAIEFNKLIERFGEETTAKAIALLDQYVMSKGKKYSSHYHTLLGWPTKQAADSNKQTELSDWEMKR